MDVLAQFPVRRNIRQKTAFRNAVQAYAEGLGYKCTVEKGSFGCQNLVIGNPDLARYLVTAHYDTPPCMPFPNFITPCNGVVYFAYQFGIVFAMLLLAIIPAALMEALFHNRALTFYAWYFTYLLLLALTICGPANPTNANDNTSGVVTLLKLAESLPVQHRADVCFVLFDMEETGMHGSKSYRNTHKLPTETQIVLNMDCVGDGDIIMAFPGKKLRADQSKMELLDKISYTDDSKKVVVHKQGFFMYPSDQRNFPYGVGIAAFKQGKRVGLYCDRIHTKKDTVLDEDNVNILRDRLIAVITG